MSVNLIDDSYVDRLPSSISGDSQVQAFGNGQDVRLIETFPFIDQVRVLCNIGAQSEQVLDLLAFQFQVLFYSGTFSIADPVQRIAAKRALIAKSFDYNSRLGTPAILQEILVTIYQNAYVQEWFEYGGTPHHFRILTDNVINDPVIVASVTGVVSVVKRASSWFEGFYTATRSPDALVNVFTAPYAQTFLKAPRALYRPGTGLPLYIPDPNSSIQWNTPPYPIGVPGDIPNISTMFADVTQAPYNADPTGVVDATSAINAALAACPVNRFVYMPTGTYLITGTIQWPSALTEVVDHIALRGDGPTTVIMDRGAAGSIKFGADTTAFTPTVTPMVSILSQGQNTLTVSDASKFVVGQMIVIDQDNDQSEIGTPNDHGMPDNKSTRLMRQVVRITGKSGNNLTINPSSYWNWNASLNPTVSDMGYSGVSGDWKTTFCGIENLMIDRSGATGTAPSILMQECYGCWLNNVSIRNSPAAHIVAKDSLLCTVTGCTVDGTQTHPQMGNGGIVLYRRCAGFYVYDNLIHQVSPAIEVDSGSCGCVIAYNYSRDNMTDSGLQGPAFNSNHGGHTFMNLFEGNVGGQFQSDGYYGSSSRTVLYRNNFTGVDEDSGLMLNSKCVDLDRWTQNYTIVGNVLGTATITTSYEQSSGTNFATGVAVVFRIGYPNPFDNTSTGKIPPDNPLTSPQSLDIRVLTSTTRIGNFDSVNGLTPLTFTFPPSLYLNSKPNWFGSIPWPPIGPDVSGLLIQIPAQRRWFGATLPY